MRKSETREVKIREKDIFVQKHWGQALKQIKRRSKTKQLLYKIGNSAECQK